MATEIRDVSIVPALPFRYTFEDFEETHVIVDRRRQRLLSSSRDRSKLNTAPSPFRNIRYVFIAILAAGMFALIKFGDDLPGFLAMRPGEDLPLKLLGPVFLVVAALAVSAQIGARAKRRRFRIAKTAAERSATRFAVLYPVAGLIYIVVAFLRSLDSGTTATLLHDFTMVIVPWAFISLAFFLLGNKSRKRGELVLQKTWEESPHLHCEKRINITMKSFRLADFQACYELDWELFKGEEGENLFVLIAGGIFFMVPKRVLSMQQIEFIRDRLGLRPVETRTGGFPVVQVQPE